MDEFRWGTVRAVVPTMLGDEEQTLYFIVPDSPAPGVPEVVKTGAQVDRSFTSV